MMKAVVYDIYGSPDVLRVEDVQTPTPGEGEVLVKVHAASINSWDWDMIRGEPIFVRMWGLKKPKYRIPGADVAGTVEAIGSSVTRFTPGDEVFGDLSNCGWGGFAEYVCAPVKAIIRKPSGLSFEYAAALPQAGVMALQGLRDIRPLQEGDRLLMNGGAGAVGTIAIQLAKTMGAEVIAVDSTEKLDLMRSLGADHVIDYTKEDFTRSRDSYDLILDVTAQHSMFDYHRSLRKGGCYVMIGGATARMFQFLFIAPWLSRVGNKKLRILAHRVNKNLAELGDMVVAGTLKPVIDRTYSLEGVSEAFRYFSTGGVRGKIVITMDEA